MHFGRNQYISIRVVFTCLYGIIALTVMHVSTYPFQNQLGFQWKCIMDSEPRAAKETPHNLNADEFCGCRDVSDLGFVGQSEVRRTTVRHGVWPTITATKIPIDPCSMRSSNKTRASSCHDHQKETTGNTAAKPMCLAPQQLPFSAKFEFFVFQMHPAQMKMNQKNVPHEISKFPWKEKVLHFCSVSQMFGNDNHSNVILVCSLQHLTSVCKLHSQASNIVFCSHHAKSIDLLQLRCFSCNFRQQSMSQNVCHQHCGKVTHGCFWTNHKVVKRFCAIFGANEFRCTLQQLTVRFFNAPEPQPFGNFQNFWAHFQKTKWSHINLLCAAEEVDALFQVGALLCVFKCTSVECGHFMKPHHNGKTTHNHFLWCIALWTFPMHCNEKDQRIYNKLIFFSVHPSYGMLHPTNPEQSLLSTANDVVMTTTASMMTGGQKRNHNSYFFLVVNTRAHM